MIVNLLFVALFAISANTYTNNVPLNNLDDVKAAVERSVEARQPVDYSKMNQ